MNDFEKGFRQPDAAFSAVPLWFWFGTLTMEKLTRQIDEMVDKGVYGAFLHARPYLWDGDRLTAGLLGPVAILIGGRAEDRKGKGLSIFDKRNTI